MWVPQGLKMIDLTKALILKRPSAPRLHTRFADGEQGSRASDARSEDPLRPQHAPQRRFTTYKLAPIAGRDAMWTSSGSASWKPSSLLAHLAAGRMDVRQPAAQEADQLALMPRAWNDVGEARHTAPHGLDVDNSATTSSVQEPAGEPARVVVSEPQAFAHEVHNEPVKPAPIEHTNGSINSGGEAPPVVAAEERGPSHGPSSCAAGAEEMAAGEMASQAMGAQEGPAPSEENVAASEEEEALEETLATHEALVRELESARTSLRKERDARAASEAAHHREAGELRARAAQARASRDASERACRRRVDMAEAGVAEERALREAAESERLRITAELHEQLESMRYALAKEREECHVAVEAARKALQRVESARDSAEAEAAGLLQEAREEAAAMRLERRESDERAAQAQDRVAELVAKLAEETRLRKKAESASRELSTRLETNEVEATRGKRREDEAAQSLQLYKKESRKQLEALEAQLVHARAAYSTGIRHEGADLLLGGTRLSQATPTAVLHAEGAYPHAYPHAYPTETHEPTETSTPTLATPVAAPVATPPRAPSDACCSSLADMIDPVQIAPIRVVPSMATLATPPHAPASDACRSNSAADALDPVLVPSGAGAFITDVAPRAPADPRVPCGASTPLTTPMPGAGDGTEGASCETRPAAERACGSACGGTTPTEDWERVRSERAARMQESAHAVMSEFQGALAAAMAGSGTSVGTRAVGWAAGRGDSWLVARARLAVDRATELDEMAILESRLAGAEAFLRADAEALSAPTGPEAVASSLVELNDPTWLNHEPEYMSKSSEYDHLQAAAAWTQATTTAAGSSAFPAHAGGYAGLYYQY
jgi:hypothetical protein